MHDLVWFATRPAVAVDGVTRLLRVMCAGGLLTCEAGVSSIEDAELWIGWHREFPEVPATELARQHGRLWLALGSVAM